MSRSFVLLLLLLRVTGFGQEKQPSKRVVAPFAVHGASRLAALAKVGALTHTTLLIEAGDLKLLQAPVDLTVDQTTLSDAVDRILGRGVRHTLRDQGHLVIVSTAMVRDRLLDLPLGPFQSAGGGYSSLDGELTTAIWSASGCEPMGTAWAGFETAAHLPAIHLAEATFEQVVAQTAEGPEAGIWIVPTRERPSGCLENLGDAWQFGLYGFGMGNSSYQQPLSTSAGPEFLKFLPQGHAFPEPCNAGDRHATAGASAH